jgi:hypothetical protein
MKLSHSGSSQCNVLPASPEMSNGQGGTPLSGMAGVKSFGDLVAHWAFHIYTFPFVTMSDPAPPVAEMEQLKTSTSESLVRSLRGCQR